MASVVLCKDDGLWAMLPERSGGEAYSLRRVDAATANSAEALAAVAAVASGSACIIDLQRYRDAVTRLSHAELVQAIIGAILLGASGRPLSGLLPALQRCSEVVAGAPTLPEAVLVGGSAAFGSSGGSGGRAASPSVFELMHLLLQHRVNQAAGRPPIQFDAAKEEQQQLRQQRQQLPSYLQQLPAHLRHLPAYLQQTIASPAAALAAGGSELWVRWADSANDWCMFRQAPGEQPCARCSCGYAGFGLLFCEHLASAYRSFVAPAEVTASTGKGSSSGGGSSSGRSAPSSSAAVALDVAALEAACAELTNKQLGTLLLCTVLYTGAAGVLQDGLGLDVADLRPLGGAGLAPEVAAMLATSKPSVQQTLAASKVQIGPYGIEPTAKDPPPGCSLGSWRAACPAAAGPVGCATVTLLQHAAQRLPPASAEGYWLGLKVATGLTGLPLDKGDLPVMPPGRPSGVQLLQAAQLLLDAGYQECGRHLLQEWEVALSFLPAWPADAEQWRPGLVQLWQQFMPAAAQQISWWMSQLAVPCSGEQQGRLDQQRQRLSAVCSVDYIQLIEELLGPVAAAQLTAVLLEGLSRAASRHAARSLTSHTKTSHSIDLNVPSGSAGVWLASVEAVDVEMSGRPCNLLQSLQTWLDQKAVQQAAGKQPQADRPGSGRRKVKRRNLQSGAAGGQATAGAPQGLGQGPQLPPRSVGEAPTLLKSAAHAMAERLLVLPLDQALQLFDGLVPDLEPIVLQEIAALQAPQVHALHDKLKALLKQAQQGLPRRQPSAGGEAADAAAAGSSAAAAAAAVGGPPRQQPWQEQGQQPRPRLQDLYPNQQESVIQQLLNTMPPASRNAYRHVPRAVLASQVFWQTLFEQRRRQLRIPPPAGQAAALAAMQQRLQQQGQPGQQQQQQQQSEPQQPVPQPRGLLDMLEAAAAPQPAASQRRLAYAACFALEQMCRKDGLFAMRQLDAEGGAGWRHIVTLLEQAQPQHCNWSYDLLPSVLAVVRFLFTEAEPSPSTYRGRRQQQSLGVQQQQSIFAQQRLLQAAAVPAELLDRLVRLLPRLLDACCEAAWEALHGHCSSSSSGSSTEAVTAPAAVAEPQAQPGSRAAFAGRGSNRSVVADRDALALALSGIHSCLKLAAGLEARQHCPAAFTAHHAATLRRLMAPALVRANAVLLDAAVATDQAAAEVFASLYLAAQHDWTTEMERAAAALLPLLPWTVPAAADDSRPSTSAAAAEAASNPAASLLSLWTELLPAAAAALQCARFSTPVRRSSLALLCRGLQAAATSQHSSAAERQQATEALLRLVVSPATAGELHPADMIHQETQQLMECALGAAAAALRAGSSYGGLGGELAYLAVNLLAHSARSADVPQLTTAPTAATRGIAAREKEAAAAAQHAGWQVAALQVVEWWQVCAGGGSGCAEPLAGSPPPLFCASTLMALLLKAYEPSVQALAVAALSRLAAADSLLLLRCDSLPQLVHLAARQVFRPQSATGTGSGGSSSSSSLQSAVDTLLISVRMAATAAGRAEQHMWPVWRQHPPSSSLPHKVVPQSLGLLAAAVVGGPPVEPWDRLTARLNVLQTVGGGSSSAGGRVRGAAPTAAGGSSWAAAAEVEGRRHYPRMDPYAGDLYSDYESDYMYDDYDAVLYDEDRMPVHDHEYYF